MFQTHASEANRARVLSVYTFGVMGSAPIGALLAGLLGGQLGLHGALAVVAGLAFAITIGVTATSALWHANEPALSPRSDRA